MFDFTSRYYTIETAKFIDANGRVIAYKRRRFLPPIETMQILTEIMVTQGDRTDLITARSLGAPEQFWSVCDGNTEMNPFDLTTEIGRTVRIPAPQPQV